MSASAFSTHSDPQQSTLLRVCRIGRAQGLKGEVNVVAFTDEHEVRFAPDSVLLTAAGAEGTTFTVERSRNFKKRWIIKFAGIDDRTAAEALNGTLLYIEPDALDDSDDDGDEGYYLKDLVDLEAQAEDGTLLGTVTGVMDRPGQSLLEITEPQGAVSLIPFVEQIVPEVDIEAGVIILDPPGGLLQEH